MKLKDLLLTRDCLFERRRIIQDGIAPELAEIDEDIRAIDQKIAAAIAEPLKAARSAAGKDTGTVNVQVSGVAIKQDIPKRVKWDQGKLCAIVAKIRMAGDDPEQYVKIKIDVPESNYKAWPDSIRKVFAPARTVEVGNPTVTFTILDEVAA